MLQTLCTSVHGLRTTWSPDRSRSPDHLVSGPLMVSGSCRFGQSRSLPFPDHRPRSAGWAWARMPRHARTAYICKDTHCLALGFHGGSTHLLLQAHPCPGSSATFSNPGKKNCGRFGLALFFWVVLFGFKLGAVQLALTINESTARRGRRCRKRLQRWGLQQSSGKLLRR